MTDYNELKLMAEAATGFTDMSLAPDVVLALIAENESAHKHWENQSNNVQALTAEVVRLTTQVRLAGVSAEMTVHQEVGRAITETFAAKIERDQLKADNERLRNESADALAVNRTIRQQLDCYVKDAERYRRMRAVTLNQADDTPEEFDAEFDKQIEEVMSREAIRASTIDHLVSE